MRFLVYVLWLVAVMVFPRAEVVAVKEGARFEIGGRSAEITRVQMLPYVEDEYSRRFLFDSAFNPKLGELRGRYKLQEVVASGKDEFEKQVLLNDWVHRQFKKFGQPSDKARGALQILEGMEKGNTYFCAQYVELMVSASASLGWTDRLLALRRHKGANAKGGSTEHSTTEIWSNQYGKWIMLDPTSNMHLEKDGLPLNAWEIREEWFYRGGTNLTFVVGKERKKYRKADLPIFLAKFEGFGDLTVEPDELDKYGFIGYVPNTNLMDAGNDYGQMFITKDQLCEGTQWHKRLLPKNPATDPYFPINQVAVELEVDEAGGELKGKFRSFTPNFKTFEATFNGAHWSLGEFKWRLKPGLNRLVANSVNQFDVKGTPTVIEIVVK